MVTPERYERLGELFSATCKLSPRERAAALDRECADDPSLRRDVEALLAKDSDPSSFLENPALGDDFRLEAATPAMESERSLVGERISHYRLTRVIAAGGMGTVYEAEQDKPKRTVAVKVMRRGITSRSALRRFEYEAQILARLRHPGIAQVYEAGSYDDGGEPYFVMEHVPDAKPITDYAQTEGLTTRRRLELFADVCDAVQHGHQRGIIHRDLKPGNILVDSAGRPKVIDFGVARATDSDMAVTTLQTDVGQLLGTLQYMSPEQCEANPHDLDTRSDVYALGVVLYQLLCEQLPYDVSHAGVPEAVQAVREEIPTRPSSINYTLRGDVETIVLKALEKERDRRYQSSADFARDVRRYLGNEPILARPPSAMYQLKKLVTRHKAPFAFIAALFVLTAGSSVWMTVLYGQAGAERDRAVDAEHLSEERLAETEEARDESDTVTEFLADMLAAVDPAEEGKEVTVLQVLGQAAETIGEEFEGKPLIEARLRHTIGETYRALGEYGPAELHLERALEIRRRLLGEEHLDTLTSMNSLGLLYRKQGRYDEAEVLQLQALEIRKRVLGEEHPDTLRSMMGLANVYLKQGRYDEAEPLYKRSLAIKEKTLGPDHPDVAVYVNNLAVLYKDQGKYDQAESLQRRAVAIKEKALGPDHPDVAVNLSNLAALYGDRGRYGEAEPMFARVLETLKRNLGEEHPDTVLAMNNLAWLYGLQGRYDEAEPLYLQTLETDKRILGEEHPRTLGKMSNLGDLYRKQGRYDEAELLLRQALETRKRVLGEDHPQTLASVFNLASLYGAQGRYDEAKPLNVQVMETRQRVLGDDDPDTLTSINSMGILLQRMGKLAEAEPYHREALEGYRRVLGDDHPGTLTSVNNMGMLLQRMVKLADAEPYLREALEGRRRVLGDDHPGTLRSINNMGGLLQSMGKYDEAEPYF
ncbi:MAG: tetratricopeptide repeat protein, partial [Planctomycetota bacterium]